MNRKQRRAAAKRQPLNMPMSQQKLLANLCKNGITNEDLKTEFFKGVEAGRRAAIKTIYAAVLYAANDMQMDNEHMDMLIKAVDRHVCDTLSSEEVIDNVYRDTGYRLTFADPFETIERVN